ncbi:hypothetical protein COB72_02725 [bacterium]|nr:MAG: hypothetical protein COB72_02725 [bacterium]
MPIRPSLNLLDGLKSNMNPRTDDLILELDQIKLTLNPRLGASIVSLMIKNQAGQWAPVFRTMPSDSESASDAGSFVMLPWTNRIKDAQFTFADQTHRLKPNSSDNTAIHGVARDLAWAITDRSPITARFVLDSRSFEQGRINSPFKFGAVQRFEIGPDSVEIDLSITNLDDHPIPVGCGHHPYIHRQLFSDADDLHVQLDVAGRYPTAGCIPTGEPEMDEVCQAFINGDSIGNPGLDDVFAGFGGLATFDWAASNICMTMQCSENLNHVVIYTPKLADGKADAFVCIEPVSMVNDGFNRHAAGKSNTGVVILEPNETMRTRMTLRFSACS